MKKRIALAALAASLWSVGAHAAAPELSPTETAVKGLLLGQYKTLPPSLTVRQLPFGGLFEVNMLGQEAYTNAKGEFLLIGGSLVDAKNLEDVTLKRRPQFLREFFESLPLENAIKTAYGKGERVVVSFEDPDCPRCREQHAEWSKRAASFNATVYTFMFPLKIHPDARRKAEFIWCQPDPSAAWRRWMEQGQGLPLTPQGALSPQAPASCKAGVEKVRASEKIARGLGYHSTPRFIFANGKGISAMMEASKFEAVFAEAQRDLDAIKAPAKGK